MKTLAKLYSTLVASLSMRGRKARLAKASVDTSPMAPTDFAAFIQAETAKWERGAREAGIPKQ